MLTLKLSNKSLWCSQGLQQRAPPHAPALAQSAGMFQIVLSWVLLVQAGGWINAHRPPARARSATTVVARLPAGVQVGFLCFWWPDLPAPVGPRAEAVCIWAAAESNRSAGPTDMLACAGASQVPQRLSTWCHGRCWRHWRWGMSLIPSVSLWGVMLLPDPCCWRQSDEAAADPHLAAPQTLQEQGCAYCCRACIAQARQPTSLHCCLQSLEGPESSGASADAAGDQAEGALPIIRSR